MGIVSISSSPARTPLGLSTNFATQRSKRPLIVAFKADKSNITTLVAPHEKLPLPIEAPKKHKKGPEKGRKSSKRVKAVSTDEASPCTSEMDYNEAAAKLESIYKLSPSISKPVVRNIVRKRPKRLSLDKRIELRKNKVDELVDKIHKRKDSKDEQHKIEKLVRDYSSSTDLVSLDWKKMKIPPVLSSTEHSWLFKLMQPMKVLLQVKENLEKDLGKEQTVCELAKATNMSVVQVRKCLEVGRAARNKLIKHNLRLVLFVMNIYFRDFSNGPRFQDLCQAGAKGLITAINRFEPERRFRLSTYGLFWIRHAIIRSMTILSFTRVPFGLESVRVEIQRAKLELLFELQRIPTEEEIIEKVGISPERYREVMKASKPVASLHSRHAVTQEEFINGISDVDGVGAVNQRQSALLRLALDDVLDSLKPKESLVIRQRYGLDGKGDRTWGEIAGNLNISREMVRKHEVKALMKLKHPTRLHYLRQHIV